MKIALLHYAAPPIVGGVESVIGRHARLMTAGGHTVTLIAGRGAQTDEAIRFISIPEVDSSHPEVAAVKAELDHHILSRRFEDLKAAIVEKLSVALQNMDILAAHNVGSLNKNLALTAALKQISENGNGPRLILWHHDLAWTTPRYRSELYDEYPWNLLKTAWPGADQVTVSEARRQELAELFGIEAESIRVVPNGIDAAEFLKLGQLSIHYAKRFHLLDRTPLFLLPVRITRRKNIELAIRVIAELQADFPNAALLVTGPPGPHNVANLTYLNELLELRSRLHLEENVIFMAEAQPDYLPDEVVADFYRLADALLLPSREEGFGIPVLEAGISGMPIFCSAIPQLRELGGTHVHYFSADEPAEVVAKMIHSTLRQDSTYQLRKLVKMSYTWERIYSEIIGPLLREEKRENR